MTEDARLDADELMALIERVFAPRDDDQALAILVDLPDDVLGDNAEWRVRRRLAMEWARELATARDRHGRDVELFWYRNVRANNADLPEWTWRAELGESPDHCDALDGRAQIRLEEVLSAHRLVVAPTELSATAPLKMLAPRFGFRAATMPGFSPAMVPALRLDYVEVNRRVYKLKRLLDDASAADFEFAIEGGDRHRLQLDLRHRTAHASGGLLHEPGTAGNLPSGESYIVPYEGELEGDPSRSEGVLPVQIDGEVVLHRIHHNRAVDILSDGPVGRARATELASEPAAANLAELGLGVLSGFGVRPIGEVLLDEKLGPHIAFGRSEHFGGQVGPADFTSPDRVVHQDWVYLPELQPDVAVQRLQLAVPTGVQDLIRDGVWVLAFD
jgi:hypothetical protein